MHQTDDKSKFYKEELRMFTVISIITTVAALFAVGTLAYVFFHIRQGSAAKIPPARRLLVREPQDHISIAMMVRNAGLFQSLSQATRVIELGVHINGRMFYSSNVNLPVPGLFKVKMEGMDPVLIETKYASMEELYGPPVGEKDEEKQEN